jgi:hypothetical protein
MMGEENTNTGDRQSARSTPLGYAPPEPREPLAVNLARGAIACAILWLALVLVACRDGTPLIVFGILAAAAAALGLGLAAHFVGRRGPPTGPTTQAVAAAVVGVRSHCSYVYVGSGLSAQTATAQHVLAHEYVSNHKNTGMNVLYGDGTVQWLQKAEAERVLSELQQGHNPPRDP